MALGRHPTAGVLARLRGDRDLAGQLRVPVDEEVAVYRLAGVAPDLDLDLVCDIAGGLHAEYTAARMTRHARQVRRQHAHALAAATGTSPT